MVLLGSLMFIMFKPYMGCFTNLKLSKRLFLEVHCSKFEVGSNLLLTRTVTTFLVLTLTH